MLYKIECECGIVCCGRALGPAILACRCPTDPSVTAGARLLEIVWEGDAGNLHNNMKPSADFSYVSGCGALTNVFPPRRRWSLVAIRNRLLEDAVTCGNPPLFNDSGQEQIQGWFARNAGMHMRLATSGSVGDGGE